MEEPKIMDKMNAMEVVENIEAPVNSGNGIVGAVVAGVGIAVVGAVGAVGAFAYKNRDRFEARKIEKLKKKGYVIYKEEELESEPEPIEEIE